MPQHVPAIENLSPCVQLVKKSVKISNIKHSLHLISNMGSDDQYDVGICIYSTALHKNFSFFIKMET